MMLQSGKAYTPESLLTDICTTFGSGARFYTCSAENLTAQGLIDFLQTNGKFVAGPDGFQISADRVCHH
jgi:probable metal-binding protein